MSILLCLTPVVSILRLYEYLIVAHACMSILRLYEYLTLSYACMSILRLILLCLTHVWVSFLASWEDVDHDPATTYIGLGSGEGHAMERLTGGRATRWGPTRVWASATPNRTC